MFIGDPTLYLSARYGGCVFEEVSGKLSAKAFLTTPPSTLYEDIG